MPYALFACLGFFYAEPQTDTPTAHRPPATALWQSIKCCHCACSLGSRQCGAATKRQQQKMKLLK